MALRDAPSRVMKVRVTLPPIGVDGIRAPAGVGASPACRPGPQSRDRFRHFPYRAAEKVIANVSLVPESASPDVRPRNHISGSRGELGRDWRDKSLFRRYCTRREAREHPSARGSGWISDVIAGVEWAIANRAKYNIKVLNMSLGHPVTEPSATDPLCQAVMKATQAGIFVVVSAGNSGRRRCARFSG